ncbi:MAG: DUF4097 family beta strand repeat-containing protein [Pyrinomonadaceae bacterium]
MKTLATLRLPAAIVVMFLTAAAAAAAAPRMYGQARMRSEPPMVAPPSAPEPVAFDGNGVSIEKSIAVDPGVSISLCVSRGSLKVNGWNRKELRVYVAGASKFAFNVRDKNPQTGLANWLMIENRDVKVRGDCLVAESIELDVPMGSKIDIKGSEATITIDSVSRAKVNTVGGKIAIRNVTNGVTATNLQGDVQVESSAGTMSLESTTGNIIAFDVSPAEIGDPFRAKTHSGTISMQSLQHRQVEVGTISGSVIYNGSIRSGGSYIFNTNKGSIRMILPANAAFQLQAIYGAGNFVSEIPFKLETENIAEGPIKIINGRLGTAGDASVRLTTSNGSITIKKP